MIVVDASVWVSTAIPADAFERMSSTWLARGILGGEEFAGPTLVLAEVAGAVSRKLGDIALADLAVGRLTATPRMTLLPLDDALAREAARLAADLGLRGADATYAAVARRLGCPLVTWDAELIRKTDGIIDARQPSP